MANKKYHNKAFGRVLQRLRAEKKWSQEFLGFEATLTRTTISLLERGQRSPTLDTIIMLCSALDVRLDELSTMILNEMESHKND